MNEPYGINTWQAPFFCKATPRKKMHKQLDEVFHSRAWDIWDAGNAPLPSPII